MSANKLKLVRGTGNVFRDLGEPDADRQQLKALLAAEIVRVLDEGRIAVRKAETMTGIAAADFSRIRNADLGRFTIDRLMIALDRLGQQVKIAVDVRPRRRAVA